MYNLAIIPANHAMKHQSKSALVTCPNKEYQCRALLQFANNHDFLQRYCNTELVEDENCKWIDSSPFARVFSITHNGDCYFHKTFLPRTAFEFVKSFFRGSRAKRSLTAAEMLIAHGFLVPQVVMAGVANKRDFVMTRAVPQCISAAEFFTNPAQLPSQYFSHLKRQKLKHLGKIIGKLHSAGIFHGDLLLGNILLGGDDYKIYFIDNERTRRLRIFTTKARLKNLTQLNRGHKPLSKTDRLRFLNQYLQYNPTISAPAMISKVLARTAKKYTNKRT